MPGFYEAFNNWKHVDKKHFSKPQAEDGRSAQVVPVVEANRFRLD